METLHPIIQFLDQVKVATSRKELELAIASIPPRHEAVKNAIYNRISTILWYTGPETLEQKKIIVREAVLEYLNF